MSATDAATHAFVHAVVHAGWMMRSIGVFVNPMAQN